MDGNKVDDGHCQHLCSALTCYHALCKSAPDNAFVIGATYRGTRPESSLRAEVTRAHQAPDLRCSPWMIPQRSNHVYKVSRRRDDVCVTPQDRKPTQWYGQLVATTRQAYARCATQRDEGFSRHSAHRKLRATSSGTRAYSGICGSSGSESSFRGPQ